MEDNTKFLSIFTEQQLNQIYDNLRTFEDLIIKDKKNSFDFESSKNSVYEHFFSDISNIILENLGGRDEVLHDLFVKYCLAPDGYKTGNGDVFACVVGREINGDENIVNISVATPIMVYVDNRYFSSEDSNDNDIISSNLKEAYRPYYYEFSAILSNREFNRFNNQIHKLQIASEYDDTKGWSFWFKAKLEEKNEKNYDGYTGILHFGGSTSSSAELEITSLEPVSSETIWELNKTYKIKVYPNDQECINYLDSFFGKANNYNVRILNVGQANCIYIENKNTNKHFFFDLGRPNSGFYDWSARKYVSNDDLLPGSCIQRNLNSLSSYNPDCIFISHWHLDHFAAYKDLNNYGIGSVWILPKIVSKKDIKSANRLLNYLATNKVTVYYLNSIGKIYDNGVVQLLSSTSAKDSDPNSRSLMLKINSTLFSADCLYEYWPDYLKNNLNSVMRLVVPHHCSKLSKTTKGQSYEKAIFDSFRQTQFKQAYICKGFNTYHHPNPDHLTELCKATFNILFTENTLDHYEFDT